MKIPRFRKPNLWKGMAAGAIGGLAGAYSMTLFQSGWSKLSEKLKHGNSNQQQQSHDQGDSEDATMKMAGTISELLGHPLTKEQRKTAGPVVHYVFGAAVGALYGAAAEYLPSARVGGGVPFGALVFVTADETAVPALKLSKPPTEYPVPTHIYSLASHAVYGLSTELARRGTRRLLGH
jgi:putative membrane protein